MCLLSICSGGLEEAVYSSLRTAFLHAYGFDHLTTFQTLESLGLFNVKAARTTAPSFVSQRDRHGLVRQEGERVPQAGQDKYSRFYGFAPMSVALVESSLMQAESTGRDAKKEAPQTRDVVVFFLGGVTPAEIAALRDLQLQHALRITVASTSIFNTKAFLTSIAQLRAV
jgi:hypothetical protein